MAERIANNDLEETVFHASVHATLDLQYSTSQAWVQAQAMDAAFVTQYAARHPSQEDMAESGLFAYAMLTHPGRISAQVEAQVRAIMPNRLAFFADVFAGPTFEQVGPAPQC